MQFEMIGLQLCIYNPIKPGFAGTSHNLSGAEVKSNLDSAECQAFQKCFAVLSEGISDPGRLASQLYFKDMISSNLKQVAQLVTFPAPTRTHKLLSAVEDQIITKKSKFRDFLYILHSDPSLEHLAKKLEEAFSKFSVSLKLYYN